MLTVFRDRGIILACLVLYALGMVLFSMQYAKASQPVGGLTSSSFSILCSGDVADDEAQDHCPYCRVTDEIFVSAPTGFLPQIGWSFASFVDDAALPVAPQFFGAQTPARAPPIFA